jgi:hypothetical protein
VAFAARRRADGLEVVLDPEVAAWVGGGLAFAALIGALVLSALRGSDPARAIASLEVAANTTFALSFAAKPGEYRVWLRFDLAHGGDEDACGLTAALDVTGAGPPLSVEHRIGDDAPVLGGAAASRNTTLVRVVFTSDSNGSRLRASARIATLVAPPPGANVDLRGRVVLAQGYTARSLLIFVVPA